MKHGAASMSGIRQLAAVAGLFLCLCASRQARTEPGSPPAPARAEDAHAAEPAHAPDIERAREHYTRGERLFALGRFREAMAAYEAAYEASSLPELLFNIGQCHRNLGNYQSAVFSFQQYLKHKPEAANRDAVRALIQELETAMAAADERSRGNPMDATTGLEQSEQSGRRDHASSATRWWLWSGAAAVAVTATLAALWLRGDSDVPGSDLGNLDFEYDGKRTSSRRARGLLLGLGHELRW